MNDEQRVRTMAGWIGVEISKSRVRTPGKAGYGLYRVRGERNTAGGWVKSEWTAYALGLGAIESAVDAAIRNGSPSGPGSLITGVGVVPTRWTSVYRGSRTLGTERPIGAFGASFEVPCDDETEPDGERCTGVVRYGPDDPQARCSVCGGWRGRFAPLTARQRQRMHNAEFQAEHKIRRDYGLRQRHARKLAHNARKNNEEGR